MTLLSRIIIVVILLELLAGGVVLARSRPAKQSKEQQPPLPDLSIVDHVAAAEIRRAAEHCHTAEEWRYLAELLMGNGYFTEAEMCHRVACDRDPKNPVLAFQWAFALERLALLDEANAQYRRAIELGYSPADDCRYFIARNMLRAEKPNDARVVFTEGKALPACRYELARLHHRAGELTQAVELLDGLVSLYPKAMQPYQYRYRIELDRGEGRKAFADADHVWRAIEKMPTPFDKEYDRLMEVWKTTGVNGRCKECQTLIRGGKAQEAEPVLREMLRQGWESQVVDMLAEVESSKGNHSETVRLLEEINDRDGPAAHNFARLGDAWEAMGKPEKARENWLRAVQMAAGQDLKNTHFKLSQSYEKAGDKQRSEAHLAKAYYFAGLEMIHSLRYSEAVNTFESSLKSDPKLSDSWFYLGEARRLLGQTDAAKDAYKTCLKVNPDHGRAIAALEYLEGGGK
jgi:tetratricopeptide (TPR) repeat protein